MSAGDADGDDGASDARVTGGGAGGSFGSGRFVSTTVPVGRLPFAIGSVAVGSMARPAPPPPIMGKAAAWSKGDATVLISATRRSDAIADRPFDRNPGIDRMTPCRNDARARLIADLLLARILGLHSGVDPHGPAWGRHV